MIRGLCGKQNISLAELSRRVRQTPQNFNKKLKRGTVSFEEILSIAEALGVVYEQAFVLPDGEKIISCQEERIDENNCGIKERNGNGYQTLQRVYRM